MMLALLLICVAHAPCGAATALKTFECMPPCPRARQIEAAHAAFGLPDGRYGIALYREVLATDDPLAIVLDAPRIGRAP